MANFEQGLRAIQTPTYPLDRVTAGWLMLVSRRVDHVRASEEPTDWRGGGFHNALKFLDWMAWNAAVAGWVHARQLALEVAGQQLPGQLGVGNFTEEIRRWLKEQWDSPPKVFVELLEHPVFQEARRRASAAWWLDLPTYQAMLRVGKGHGSRPVYKDGEATATLHRSWGSAKAGAFGFAVSPHMEVREGNCLALVHLGDFLPAGECTNGTVFHDHDDDGNEISGIDPREPGIPTHRLVQLVMAAVQFWDELDKKAAEAVAPTGYWYDPDSGAAGPVAQGGSIWIPPELADLPPAEALARLK
jgi:hypothetical protein